MGADAIDGGDGNDIADYRLSSNAVTIDLDAGTASGGDAAGEGGEGDGERHVAPTEVAEDVRGSGTGTSGDDHHPQPCAF